MEKLILLDIDGCIMPPNRASVDIDKLKELQSTIKNLDKSYKVTIFTGRSQGYVEFLAQVLHIVDLDYEVPFVIENGTALYFPKQKIMKNILQKESLEPLYRAKTVLKDAFFYNPFEPKENIITINPNKNQSIQELKTKIVSILQKESLLKKLEVAKSASSVDILPLGYNKFFGVKYLLDNFLSARIETIAMGDSDTDFDVLDFVDRAYLPENASETLKQNLLENKNQNTLLTSEHIDAVLNMIKMENPSKS